MDSFTKTSFILYTSIMVWGIQRHILTLFFKNLREKAHRKLLMSHLINSTSGSDLTMSLIISNRNLNIDEEVLDPFLLDLDNLFYIFDIS